MQKKVKSRYTSGVKKIIINHINKNINIYFKVLLIFIIGICIGITVINKLPETGLQSINDEITQSINTLKSSAEIPKMQILKTSLIKDILIILAIWIFGVTFAGKFILYFITLMIGIMFGYTNAAIMTTFTFTQGMLFFVTGMLLHNLISLPSIIFLIVQGINVHKDLITKKNINIKYIIVKYSIYCAIVFLLLIFASLIEVYISNNLVYSVLKYL